MSAPVRYSLFGLPLRPAHDPEFWRLPLEEQIRRACPFAKRLTSKNVRRVVGGLVDDDYVNWEGSEELADWLPNGLAGARALGIAEGLQRRAQGRGRS